MRKTEVTILANMCMVYDENGNVLVQDRVDENWPGIAFPGGHVNRNENFTDAVIREVFEETGLKARDLKICGIKQWTQKDGTRYIIFCYKTNCYSGKLKSSEEGHVQWVKLNQLKYMNLASGMEHMLRLFLEDTISEYYFEETPDGYKHILK